MMFKRALITAAAGAAALALTAGSAAASHGQPADTSPAAEGKGIPWKATHGSATVQGERWTEKTDGRLWPKLVVKGEFTNNGSGCYSVWTQWTYDLRPLPASKQATLCGKGSKSVDLSLNSYSITTTGSVYICRSEEEAKDCGDLEGLTWWPVESAR
ncbi:hypothetical protein [Streptomyces flavofungini]|uniref:hypothetical protein n=1 Tax=Streptomyces flavofungini TaxID=68200 RepID=UPI0025B19E05|nr:hypothetical protein [Streptomyces flavofungini]WJV51698.1 hypothetical protein QUY26_40270 [Streptomyces flavofungini]